jgi:AcrR family transcriptional regulator
LENKTRPFTRARQPDQIEERKEAILQSALTLFVNKGLENVSLSDIASKMGCAKSNLYRYFETREDIYLHILQREGAAWEKKAQSALKKLEGNGTVPLVAEALSKSFNGAKTYCSLMSVINSVLEKNLSAERVINFRSTFYKRRERIATLIAAALPGVPKESVQPLMFSIFAHVAGLWPLSHPDVETKKWLTKPEFEHLKLDFEDEMTRFLITLFKGALH